MRSLGLVLGVLASLVAVSVSAETVLKQAPKRTYDIVRETGFLRVGVYRDFPPYSFERQGRPAGVDVEIGRAIARELGVDFRAHWIIPDETLEDDLRNNVWKGHYLRKGQVADVMMRVPYDKEYAYMRDAVGEVINDQVVMFGPYQQEQWQIAYDGRDIGEVPTMAVFQYHDIGVEIDTLPDFYLSSAFGGRLRSQSKHHSSFTEAFQAMEAGDVDAVMGTRSEVDYHLSLREKGPYKAAANGFPGIVTQTWDVGMAVRHTHRQLAYAIEAIVDEMVRNGELASIFEKYGLRYDRPAFYDAILGS